MSIYRHPQTKEFRAALRRAFKLGEEFTAHQAAEVLQHACGVPDAGTASVYASQALRLQLTEPVADGSRLVRKGKQGKYHYAVMA